VAVAALDGPEHVACALRRVLPAAFARALGGRTRPHLVSGAADLEMLAQVGIACGACGVAPEVTAVDLCETPLAMSRWYAERRGLRVVAARGDILAFAPDARFDIVCSDSFLGQFAPPARERLIARWASLLRPGGSVITVNRLRPDADPELRVAFSPEQARAFVETVRSAAEQIPAQVRPPLAELAAEAARYARRQGAWPVRSAAELEALFARAGFEVVRLEIAPIVGAEPRATAPTVAGGAPYARIEARLREGRAPERGWP
jgi:SAM-dependent methyltransferase